MTASKTNIKSLYLADYHLNCDIDTFFHKDSETFKNSEVIDLCVKTINKAHDFQKFAACLQKVRKLRHLKLCFGHFWTRNRWDMVRSKYFDNLLSKASWKYLISIVLLDVSFKYETIQDFITTHASPLRNVALWECSLVPPSWHLLVAHLASLSYLQLDSISISMQGGHRINSEYLLMHINRKVQPLEKAIVDEELADHSCWHSHLRAQFATHDGLARLWLYEGDSEAIYETSSDPDNADEYPVVNLPKTYWVVNFLCGKAIFYSTSCKHRSSYSTKIWRYVRSDGACVYSKLADPLGLFEDWDPANGDTIELTPYGKKLYNMYYNARELLSRGKIDMPVFDIDAGSYPEHTRVWLRGCNSKPVTQMDIQRMEMAAMKRYGMGQIRFVRGGGESDGHA